MLKLKAYAKINLFLKISGKRPDGYHEIESIMQSVSLHDLITLEPITAGIQLLTDNEKLPTDNRNLAFKAAEAFLGHGSRVTSRGSKISGVKIHIEKNIPVAAGLAGGSADAAAVLFGLNLLSGNPFAEDELAEVGASIGSDIPFCLKGGTRLVKGRGEKILEVDPPLVKNQLYIIVVPEVEVPTAWAYQAWDKKNPRSPVPGSESRNDLEEVVIAKYPVIQEIKDKLVRSGCSWAQMSGSGASVFGEVGDRAQGEKVLDQVKKDHSSAFLVSSVSRGIEAV